MEKKSLILLIVVVVAAIVAGIMMTACQAGTVPPAPGQPRITNVLLGKATGVFSGYAPAYNVFDNNKMIFFISSDEASIKDGAVAQEISVEQEGSYIWGTGYYYDHSKKKWVSYQLDGNYVKDRNWITNKASATLTIAEESLSQGRNYIVAYSCKKYDNKWRCGCSSADGPCNQWMLHYYKAVNIPPEPGMPGEEPKKEELVELSISSSKKSYIPGEEVKLAPSMAGVKMLSGISTGKGLMTLKTDMNALKQDEFIIQFKEMPLLAKKNILESEIVLKEEEARKGEAKTGANGVPISALLNEAEVLRSSMPSKLQQHKTRLTSEHNAAKNEVMNALTQPDVRAMQAGILYGNNDGNDIAERIIGEYYNVFNGIAVKMNAAEAEEIKKLSQVKKVFPNRRYYATLPESAPLTGAGEVWQLDKNGNNCTETGEECITGKGITIAVIDTGVDYTHPDLGGCIGQGCKVIGGYDFINNDNEPMDDNGHGTHVAATAAGKGALIGIAPDAKILAYKVLDSGGSGSFEQVMGGIERAVDPNNDGSFSDHADIISMSLGGWGDPDDEMSAAVDNAVNAGVIAVIAAGNSGSWGVESPGTARKAITVGATFKKDYNDFYFDCGNEEYSSCGKCENGRALCDWWGAGNPKTDEVTPFSSRGPVVWEGGSIIKPDVVAPGALVCAARYDNIFPVGEHPYYKPCIDENHLELAGTSMATPIVSGAAALLKQAHPEWSPAQVKAALRNTAKDVGALLNEQGYGRINAKAAITNKPLVAVINTNGKISGIINITGTADGSDENFGGYSIYYCNSIGADCMEIYHGENAVAEGNLATLNTREINEGEYMLKLLVKGIDGSRGIDYTLIEVKNIDMKEPGERAAYYYSKNKILSIKGTVTPKDFSSYKIAWMIEGDERGPDDWSTEGITLVDDGRSEVADGLLGTWDISTIKKQGFYSLRLSVYKTNGEDKHILASVWLDPGIEEGWEKEFKDLRNMNGVGMAWSFVDQPTIADVDGDGNDDIVIAYDQNVSVLSSKGKQLPGWPVKAISEKYRVVQTGPVVTDIDGDGANEIIVGDNSGTLHIFEKDGKYAEGWPRQVVSTYIITITAADVNNDGKKEIIVAGWDSIMTVIDNNGNVLPGWPKRLDAPDGYPYFNMIREAAAAGDVDNDGYMEIAAASFGCTTYNYCAINNVSSRVYLLKHDGKVMSGWPKDILNGGIEESGMVMGDIDNDNNIEILTGSHEGIVYAWTKEGKDKEGWPKKLEGMGMLGEPALGDMNRDEFPEIAITAGIDYGYGYYNPVCIIVLDDKANQLMKKCYGEDNIISRFGGDAVISNFDDDEELEVGAMNNGGNYDRYLINNYAFNLDGSIANSFPKKMPDSALGNVMPTKDIDNDGNYEMIVNIWGIGLMVWELPVESDNAGGEWPVYKHDKEHTGLYTPSSDSLVECGNNIREGREKCDGTDNKACPGRCSECRCRPIPECGDGIDNDNDGYIDTADPGCKDMDDEAEYDAETQPPSEIVNEGNERVDGYLKISVERLVNGKWVKDSAVIDSYRIRIEAGEAIDLSSIWNEQGSYKASEKGIYRIAAELETLFENRFEAKYEFTVRYAPDS